jgi:hypothetical protein
MGRNNPPHLPKAVHVTSNAIETLYMNTVKETLEKITRTWNSFFWDNKFCQKQINFTTEVRTNYYGDILSYFNDTLDFLEDIEYNPDFQKSIFQAIGTLQTIYTHQDLIDELLYIFKLDKSTKQDKSPNREIRNELVGHPIRRIEGKLISSVFFGREFKNGKIHYILYSKENNFKGKEVLHDLQSLIENHRQYLERFTGIIWKRIEKIFRQLQKKLCVITSLMERNVEFDKLLNIVDHYYNQIIKDNYLFEPKILTDCFDKQNEHPRYKNTVNLFITTLKEYLSETDEYINDLFEPQRKKWNEVEIPKIEVRFVSMDEEVPETTPKTEDLHYEFSKLFEKHPVFGLEYFLKKFEGEPKIKEELINMRTYQESSLEYYSSLEYLRVLLIDKGLLKR